MKVIPHIPTGSKKIDTLLGRARPGFPRGELSLVAAPTAAGKTTLFLSTAAEVAHLGGMAYYISGDHTADFIAKRAATLGATKEARLQVMKVSAISALPAIINRAVRQGVDLVVVDTINTLAQSPAELLTLPKILGPALLALQGYNTSLVFGFQLVRDSKSIPIPLLAMAGLVLALSPAEEDKKRQHVVSVEVLKDREGSSKGKMSKFTLDAECRIIDPSTDKTLPTNTTSRFDREDIL